MRGETKGLYPHLRHFYLVAIATLRGSIRAMRRAAVLPVLFLPFVHSVACGGSGSEPGATPSADGGPDVSALADANSDTATNPDTGSGSDTGAPALLDSLDPSKGPFLAELAKIRETARVGDVGGAGTIERAFVAGDPFLLGAPLDRVLHATSNDCVNSPFGCPSRDAADEVLGAYPASRAGLRSALLKGLEVVDRYRWVSAAHTAIAFVNLLDSVGKLDAAARPALAAKITALASITTPFEDFQFATEVPASFVRVKGLYSLTPGLQVPTEGAATAAREIVVAVAALMGPLGVRAGSFAPFGPQDARPSQTSPAFGVLTRATALPAMTTADFAPAVDAYMTQLDATVLKAVQGQANTIDWTAHLKTLDDVLALHDASLGAIELHTPPPGPPEAPSSSAFATPPTDRGTLENDPRAGGSYAPAAGTCLVDGSKPATTDTLYMMSAYTFGWGAGPGYVIPRRIPSGTTFAAPATPIKKPVEVAPVPFSCYEGGTPTSPLTPITRAAACGVPIRLPQPCFGKFGPDHFEMIVRRVDASGDKIVLRHVYRPRADGTIPAFTWFLPRTDDPSLTKNAVNTYRVDLVSVTKGGTSIRRCAAVYWPEDGAVIDASVRNPCTAEFDAPPDLLPDPGVPGDKYVLQKFDGRIRMRPSLQFTLITGFPFTVVNDTGGSVSLTTLFSPPFADAAGLSTTDINGVPALNTPSIADKASVTLTTPNVPNAKAPHRWAFAIPGSNAVIANLYASE